ncbi:hypothetical protein niasHS_004585 [Heterodera schachtii]|uniref:Secreted protein n=1 Tax=Heterodera schachtii TaxID=97005 RepID=A0ABD2JQV8_HETSC
MIKPIQLRKMFIRLPARLIAVILAFAAFVFAVHADNDHYPAYPKGPSPHYPPRGKIPSWVHSQPLNPPGYNFHPGQNDDKHQQQQNEQQPHQSHARPGRSAAAVGASAALGSRSVAASGRASASAPALPIGLASAQKQMNAESNFRPQTDQIKPNRL